MKYFLIALLLLGASSVLGATLPCSCSVDMRPLNEAVAASKAEAKAVFVGKVVRITEPTRADGKPTGELLAEFEVVKSWKGQSEKTVIVATSNVCCVCGFPFKLGSSYIVYALGEDELYTFTCTRTKELKVGGISADEEFLGEPLKITDRKVPVGTDSKKQ